MSTSRSCTRKQSGFSLVELMVAVAIFGILAAAAVPIVSHYIEQGRVSAALKTGACVQRALTSYAAENRTFPDVASHDELAFISSTNGCELELESPADPSDPPSIRLIEYECLAVEFDPVTGMITNTCTPGQGVPDFRATFEIAGVADKELEITSMRGCAVKQSQLQNG